jgi:myosin heavy subunit
MSSIDFKTLLTQSALPMSRSAQPGARLPTENSADKKASEPQVSVTLSLSDLGKRRLLAMHQMLKSASNIIESRKANARARAAQLKQQIDVLKQVAMSLGPVAAKGLLQQIKQIAHQIRAVAADLAGESPPEFTQAGTASVTVSTTGGGEAAGSEAGDENRLAESETVVEAEAASVPQETAETEGSEETAEGKEAEQVAGQVAQEATEAEKEVADKANDQNKGVNSRDDIASQRRAEGAQKKQDVEMLRDLLREFRILLNWVKSALQNPDKADKKSLEEIDKQFAETEKLVRNLDVSANKDINSAPDLPATEASTAAVGAVDRAASVGSGSVGSIAVSV